MPKTLDTQGFSGLREEVVRSEGRSSCSSVQQTLILSHRLSKDTTHSGGVLFCVVPKAFRPSDRGPHRSPAQRVRWGKEERRHERAFAFGGSKGYTARDDARPLVGVFDPTALAICPRHIARDAPTQLRNAESQRFEHTRTPPIRVAFFVVVLTARSSTDRGGCSRRRRPRPCHPPDRR